MIREEAKKWLVNQAVSGDKEALNQLIGQYYTSITSQIQRQVADFTVVHDLAQEVCIKLFRHIKRFNSQACFSTWLYRIIQNTIKNHYRTCSNNPIHDLNAEEASADHSANPEANAIGIQLSKRLEANFHRLPEKMRTCFMLYTMNGLSYEDISTNLGCSLGTVRSRIYRTRDILRRVL